jgi:para-nitrobenzyl esterase
VGDVAVFLGIPFAEPPVGELRWSAPQPLTTRMKERDATEFAAACMQTMRILDWYRYMAETFGASRDYYEDLVVSEDCLYLNLWTPTLNTDALLPVMVWVHGGSNNSGWSYETPYRGDVLAPQGVVVVSVAYRVGGFGFLSHPDLNDAAAVANFGLWDLVAALQWIRDNIQQFGGDPDRVTLFGESSGAEDILALMMAEPSRDLFHRGVLQSTAGFGQSMPALYDEKLRGSGLGDLIGTESVRELRMVDADKVLDVYTENFDDHYHSPALDGQLLAESTWQLIQDRDFGNHELMIGTNRDEWLDFLGEDISTDDVAALASKRHRIGAEGALAAVSNETDPRRAMDRLRTADSMVCPSQNLAANRTASGGRGWMYYFSRQREDDGGSKVGAFHGAEYSYVFGSHDDYMTTTEIDRELSEVMQQYWINFAATGDPNGEGLPRWPMFERPDPVVQELGDEVRTIPAVEPELCAAFEDWQELTDFAVRYAAAWSSLDPAAFARNYAESGVLRINNGVPSEGREAIEQTAREFMTAFPDMVVKLDRLERDGDRINFHWHWTGTHTGPGGTGNSVSMKGYEQWTFDEDGLIRQSLGNYDQAEYERQLGADQEED